MVSDLQWASSVQLVQRPWAHVLRHSEESKHREPSASRVRHLRKKQEMDAEDSRRTALYFFGSLNTTLHYRE